METLRIGWHDFLTWFPDMSLSWKSLEVSKNEAGWKKPAEHEIGKILNCCHHCPAQPAGLIGDGVSGGPRSDKLLRDQQGHYTPENKHGTWRYPLGKGETFTNHQFLGSMFVLGGVNRKTTWFFPIRRDNCEQNPTTSGDRVHQGSNPKIGY